jgi:channel protein (hemolysin III family)
LLAKWVLRRFDHSAIHLLIAGTYTPFLAQMKNVLAAAGFGSRALAYLQC